MERRNFLSGLASLPLVRSTFWPVFDDEVFNGLNAQTHMTDREEAGLRGLVKTCVEETGKSLTTTEYALDGRFLTTRYSDAITSEWVTAKTYDADGRLVKTFFGQESGGPATEVLYEYDEGGRLKEIRDENGNQISYHYDQQGRKTEIRRFAPEVSAANRRSTVVARDFWVPPNVRQGVPTGGSVTTLFGERDLPIELQLLDSEKRVVSRFVRTYDENGRIMEENQIQENPALLMLSRCAGEAREKLEKLDDKQFEAMNKVWKTILRGKNGTGKSFTYDSQGRVTEMRDRNWGSERFTATSYNEQGDIREVRETISSNLIPIIADGFQALLDGGGIGGAFTIGADGTLMPDPHEKVSDQRPLLDRPDLKPQLLNLTEFRYQYDQNGNWTERTIVRRQEVDSSESGESSPVFRRTLTYF